MALNPWRWNRWYSLKSYIRDSLWFVPFVAIVGYWLFSRLTQGVDGWLTRLGYIDEMTDFYGVSMTGARALLETVVTLNISFLVFTFGSLLVAIQVAGGQYTPRIIATTLLRDNAIRVTVGYFVFTMLFSVRALIKMGDAEVPQFNVFVGGVLGLLSMAVFLYLIDYAARLLRPVAIVHRLGGSGLEVIRSVYPSTESLPRPEAASQRLVAPQRTLCHAGTSGIVLAVDIAGLVERARRADGIIEFVPQVGDFLAVDEPLFRLYGGATAIDDRQLRGAVALGSERTMDQDPTFAFRILVDIAIKALSSAINDPTTAVLALDQLHRLLRLVGLRRISGEDVFDADGALRLVYRTPNWQDFVHITCTEIRHCGAGSVQVVRRLRSLLENLLETLPPRRHAELRQQLGLLDRTIADHYAFPEDLALARIGDSQGLGGSLGIRPACDAATAGDPGVPPPGGP